MRPGLNLPATRLSISGRSEVHASITEERVDWASSGGAYAATTNPPARARTDGAASGKTLESRRLSSSGVSPGLIDSTIGLPERSIALRIASISG